MLKVHHIPYDHCHFSNQRCGKCCVPVADFNNKQVYFVKIECRVLPSRLTIQEELQNYTKYSTHYGTGSTVALHATALAVLLGCNPVHVYGVDLNCRLGYVDNKSQPKALHAFDENLTDITNDFDIINKSAHNIGVRLVNYSKSSPLKDIMETV
jgi:hypothetical protein